MRSLRAAFRALPVRIGIAALLCVALTASAVFAVNRYIDDKVDEFQRVEMAPNPSSGSGMNFLVIGNDTRSNLTSPEDLEAYSDPELEGKPPLADTMMVLHVDGDRAYSVSFPRDLHVDIPGRGNMLINAAFNDGTPQEVVDTLQQNFQIPIDHYIEVDFLTFQGLVDAIGSVPVYFPAQARDLLTSLEIPAAGCYPLVGDQALAYVRSRHLEYFENGKWIDASPRADLDRIERQQAFIEKLGRLAMARVTDDPLIGPDMVDAVVPYLRVDQGFDREAFNTLVRGFMGVADPGGSSIEFTTFPFEERRNSQLYPNMTAAADVLARLRGEMSLAPAEGATEGTTGSTTPVVVPSQVRVKVLNASGVQGQAAAVQEALAKLGFVRGALGNDPRGEIDVTEIRHGASKRDSAALVATHFPGAQVVEDTSITTGDVVVVVGSTFRAVDAQPSGGGGSTGSTAAPPTTTISPEEACQ